MLILQILHAISYECKVNAGLDNTDIYDHVSNLTFEGLVSWKIRLFWWKIRLFLRKIRLSCRYIQSSKYFDA